MNDLPDFQSHAAHMLVMDLRMPAKGHVGIGHCLFALIQIALQSTSIVFVGSKHFLST